MKTKKIFKKTVKYLRELSIVVIGVAITVSIGLWMNKKSNEQDLKQYLTTVKIELEENAKNCGLYSKYLQKSVRYADYLSRTDKKSLNKDTLDFYKYSTVDFQTNINYSGYGCGYMNTYLPNFTSTNAFEMFKNSGAMRQMKDKELLQSLWEAYTKLEDTKFDLNESFRIKKEEAQKELQRRSEGKPVVVPMQIFYSTDIPHSMVRRCAETSEILKETVMKLEKAL